MPPLKNKRHERFAQNIVNGQSQAQAYISAGYSPTGASANAVRLIVNESIQARISELTGKIERTAIADAQEVRETLTRILRQELKEDLLAQKLGTTVEARPRADSVIRAIETLAKLEGWVGPRDADTSQLDAIAEALADD